MSIDLCKRYIDAFGYGLMVLGALLIVLGWIGLEGQRSVVEQLPYLASGGIGGLGLLGAGAAVLHLSRQFRLERDMGRVITQVAELEESMDRFMGAMTERFELRVPLVSSRGRQSATPIPVLYEAGAGRPEE